MRGNETFLCQTGCVEGEWKPLISETKELKKKKNLTGLLKSILLHDGWTGQTGIKNRKYDLGSPSCDSLCQKKNKKSDRLFQQLNIARNWICRLDSILWIKAVKNRFQTGYFLFRQFNE